MAIEHSNGWQSLDAAEPPEARDASAVHRVSAFVIRMALFFTAGVGVFYALQSLTSIPPLIAAGIATALIAEGTAFAVAWLIRGVVREAFHRH